MKFRFSVTLVFLLMFGQVFAQEEILTIPRRGYFATGLSFQMWKRENVYRPVSQMVFPVTLLLPVGRRFYLTISHTPGVSWQYEDQNIYGLSDTWIQGTGVLWDEKLMVNLGVGLPTGKTHLDSTQFELTKELSKNFYRFRLPQYGQGMCVKGGAAVAFSVQEGIVVGLGGQYIYRTAYHPVKYEYGQNLGMDFEPWDKEYRPGDEASGHVGVDFQVGENMKIMLDGIYTHYWRDMLEGSEVYRSGNKFALNLGFFYRFNEKFLWSHVIYRRRGKNELLQGLFFGEEESSNGDQLEMDVMVEVIEYEGGGLFLLGDGRLYGKNEEGTGDGDAFGGGFGVKFKISEGSVFEAQCRYMFGSRRVIDKRREEGLETSVCLKFQI
jgi:hypothetical protein